MSSFYKKELNKVKELVKEPLLELVIEHLPHLQATKKERDDAWEIIAIKLNKQLFKENFDKYKKNPIDSPEIFTLNGLVVSEIYEDLIKYIQVWDYDIHQRQMRRIPADSRITNMLQTLKLEEFYDIEVKMKLSKERFEEVQRKKYADSDFDVDSAMKGYSIEQGSDGENENSSIAQELKKLKEHENDEKIAILENELMAIQKRFDFIERENKRLLELNHQLILKMKNKR